MTSYQTVRRAVLGWVQKIKWFSLLRLFHLNTFGGIKRSIVQFFTKKRRKGGENRRKSSSGIHLSIRLTGNWQVFGVTNYYEGNIDCIMTASAFRLVPDKTSTVQFVGHWEGNLLGKWVTTGDSVRLPDWNHFYLLLCLHYRLNGWINTFGPVLLVTALWKPSWLLLQQLQQQLGNTRGVKSVSILHFAQKWNFGPSASNPDDTFWHPWPMRSAFPDAQQALWRLWLTH